MSGIVITSNETEGVTVDGITFLERISVYCPDNQFMSAWRPNQLGNNTWQVMYSCTSFTTTYSQSLCVSKATEFQEESDNVTYLDRHLVSCGKGMGLVGWNGAASNGSFFRLEYECCASTLVVYTPTPAPTVFPTLNPTPSPTSPTPLPTVSPTAAPSFSTITRDIVTGYLCPYNEQLSSGVSIYSMAQTARAVYQGDGTYVVYDELSNTTISISGPNVPGIKTCSYNDYCVLKMQNDGRLVLYTSVGDVRWSNTNSTISNVTNVDEGYQMCSPYANNVTNLFTTSKRGPYQSSSFELYNISNLNTLNNEGPSCDNLSEGSISSFVFSHNSSGLDGNQGLDADGDGAAGGFGFGWWTYSW